MELPAQGVFRHWRPERLQNARRRARLGYFGAILTADLHRQVKPGVSAYISAYHDVFFADVMAAWLVLALFDARKALLRRCSWSPEAS